MWVLILRSAASGLSGRGDGSSWGTALRRNKRIAAKLIAENSQSLDFNLLLFSRTDANRARNSSHWQREDVSSRARTELYLWASRGSGTERIVAYCHFEAEGGKGQHSPIIQPRLTVMVYRCGRA